MHWVAEYGSASHMNYKALMLPRSKIAAANDDDTVTTSNTIAPLPAGLKAAYELPSVSTSSPVIVDSESELLASTRKFSSNHMSLES